MPYRIRINYDKFSFDSTLFSVLFWFRNKWQRNWKAENWQRSWPTMAFMTCVRINFVYSIDRRSVFSLVFRLTFRWILCATILIALNEMSHQLNESREVHKIQMRWGPSNQVRRLNHIEQENDRGLPVIWFGLMVGPTVPIKVSGYVVGAPPNNACHEKFERTKGTINFYDSTTTCERYVIGNWIQCDNMFIIVWNLAISLLVFYSTLVDHFDIDTMKISISFHRINDFRRSECRARRLHFDASVKKTKAKVDREKMHRFSPQIWYNRRRWSVSMLVPFVYIEATKYYWTAVPKRMPPSQYRRVGWTIGKMKIKCRWKWSDIKLILCKKSQQNNKLSQSRARQNRSENVDK